MFDFLKKKNVEKKVDTLMEIPVAVPAVKDIPRMLDKKAQNREKRIQNVTEKTGWTRKETLARLRDAKTRWGVSFGDYDKNDLHLLAEDEMAAKCAEILAKKEQLKREKALEAQAVAARKAFIAAPHCGHNASMHDKKGAPCEELRYKVKEGTTQDLSLMKQPTPIIAACYYLGIPLPVSATCAYQPSVFVNGVSARFDDIRAALGDELMPDTEQMREDYRLFRRKFRKNDKVVYTVTDMAIFFTDWLMHCRDYGFDHNDYFEYEFFCSEPEERESYMSNGYRNYVKKLCNTDMHLFMDKGRFNDFFADVIERDWVDATKCDYDAFLRFINSHDRFFAKPLTGTGGSGACILPTNMMPPEELFEYCKEKTYIMEEVVKQHAEMAKFNEGTVNTLRIFSLVDADDQAVITGALARFGRKGSCVDNFHSGGVCALMNVETGEIYTGAEDLYGNHYDAHPDSGKQLKGFVIPNWPHIKETVIRAAEKCGGINRHVGWDIAVGASGEAEFIEGNSRPNFDVLQVFDKTGKMFVYREKIDRLAEKLHKDLYEYSHIRLDVNGMESVSEE